MKLSQTLSITTTLVALLNLLLPAYVDAHGYLHSPQARNKVRDVSGCPHCLSAGGPAKVFSNDQYRHGMCGNAYDDALQHWNQPGEVQATYTEGQVIEVEMAITAHHVGYFDFQLCDSQDITEECFFKNRLMRNGCTDVNDPNCFRVWKHLTNYETNLWVATKSSPAYDGPAADVGTTQTVTYKARMQLPQGVKCSHCVLRWHYYTTNSCTNPGNAKQTSEEFFNCADIRINSKAGNNDTPNTYLGSSGLHGLIYHKPENLYRRGSNMNYFCPTEHNSRAIGFREHYNLPQSQSCFSEGVGASCSIGDDDVPSNDNNNDSNNNNDNNVDDSNNNNDSNNDSSNDNDNNNNDSPPQSGSCGTCTNGCMWTFAGTQYCYENWSNDICSLYMPSGPHPPTEADSYYQWCGESDNNNDINNDTNNNDDGTNNNDSNDTNNSNDSTDVCSKNSDCSGCVWTLASGDSYCYPNWGKDICQLYLPQGYTWCGN